VRLGLTSGCRRRRAKGVRTESQVSVVFATASASSPKAQPSAFVAVHLPASANRPRPARPGEQVQGNVLRAKGRPADRSRGPSRCCRYWTGPKPRRGRARSYHRRPPPQALHCSVGRPTNADRDVGTQVLRKVRIDHGVVLLITKSLDATVWLTAALPAHRRIPRFLDSHRRRLNSAAALRPQIQQIRGSYRSSFKYSATLVPWRSSASRTKTWAGR
jgi:hypothetical protein